MRNSAHVTELVCPAGGLPALKAAVDNGADAVYIGLRDGTNARNFPGLNFDEHDARTGLAYVHEHGARMFLAINAYAGIAQWETCCRAVDQAANLGVDALIIADAGLMCYAARNHPGLQLHLSVQSSATNHEAIGFYATQFNIKRVVLPRVLSLPQVRRIIERVSVEVLDLGRVEPVRQAQVTQCAVFARNLRPGCFKRAAWLGHSLYLRENPAHWTSIPACNQHGVARRPKTGSLSRW